MILAITSRGLNLYMAYVTKMNSESTTKKNNTSQPIKYKKSA